MYSLAFKLGVPHITVEHYIFNSKNSVSLAGVRLLMYWYNGVGDKCTAHRTLGKALEEIVSNQPEVQEEITLALMQQQVSQNFCFHNYD